MKKLFKVVALSAALAMGMSTLAACGGDKGGNKGNGNTGTISGNYKPVDVTDTAQIEKIETEVAKINMNTIVGDMTAANWMFGVDGSIVLDVLVQEDDEYLKANGTVNLGASVKAVEETPVIGAKVNATANVKITEKFAQAMDIPCALDVNATTEAWADMSYIYANATVKGVPQELVGSGESTTQSIKMKFNTMDIIGDIMGGVEGMNGEASEEGSAMDIATIIAMAEQYGVDVSVDVSNGLKVKVATTNETLDKILPLLSSVEGGEMISQIITKDNVKTFKVEIYVAFDKNGGFEALAANVDFKLQYTGQSTFDETKTSNNVASISLKVNLKKSTSEIKVPETVANDADYQEFGNSSEEGGLGGLEAA